MPVQECWLLTTSILIPACASSSLALCVMYSGCKLKKQGDNIQPWCTPFLIWNQSVVPCPVLTVQSLICAQLFVTPWTTAPQVSLSFIISQSLLRLVSIESVMPSNHLILCHPLLFLPSIFPSIRVFSNKSALHFRQSKYWSFSFSISPSNE